MLLPKPNLKIKLLALLLLLSILPLLITNTVWFLSSRSQVLDSTAEGLQSNASDIAHQIEGYFEVKQLGLIIHTQSEAILNEDLSKSTAEFQNFIAIDSDIEQLTLINRDGKETIRVSKTNIYSPEELADQSSSLAYQMPKSNGNQKYISPIYNNQTGQPSIYIAIPIIKSGELNKEVIGILKAEYNLTSLWQTISSYKVGQDGYVFLIDERGNIIAHPNQLFVSQQKNINNFPRLSQFLSSTTPSNYLQAKYLPNESGVNSLITYASIGTTKWSAIAQTPVANVLIKTNLLGNTAMAMSVSFLVIIIFISLWASNKVIRPIVQLQDSIKSFGEGKLDYRIQINSGDEIERLSNSFNDMANKLQDSFKRNEEQKRRSDKAAELLLRRDIDLRQTNDALEEEKENISAERNKLEVLLSGIHDAVIAVDLDRKIISFNTAAEKLTGYKIEDVLGKEINFVIRVFDKTDQLDVTTYCPIRTDGFEGVVFAKNDLRLTGFANKESSVNLIAGQIKEGVNVNLGCILTLHNVSEENQLEEMKLDFVSMAAHELRTPLTSIRGYLSVFINENKSMFNPEQMMFLNRISIASNQLMSLIENLLNVSKIERGAFSVNLEPLEWEPIAKQIVAELIPRAVEKNISLQYLPSSKYIPKVAADKLRINEVLSNLVSNAISYTPPGGKIEVWIEVLGNEIVTHVRDTGEGIPKEAISHLFTKFFRVSGKLAQGSKGTGLGLYIAKSITQMHKGRIWVDSELGEGSTFSFSLPIMQEKNVSIDLSKKMI